MNFITKWATRQLKRDKDLMAVAVQEIKNEMFDKQRFDLESALNQMLLGTIQDGQKLVADKDYSQFLEKAYRINSDVYSITSLVYETQANVPWKLVEEDPEGNEEQIHDHQILEVWDRPNKNQSNKEFLEALFAFRATTGNLMINGLGPDAGNNAGQFHELFVMPPHLVDPISGGWRDPIRGYTIKWSFNNQTELDASEVLHQRSFNPNYLYGQQFMGMSPVEAAAMVVTSSNAGHTVKNRKFISGGMDGFISRDVGEGQFTKEQGEKIDAYLKARYTAYQGVYTTSANAKWNEMGMSVVDLAILDSLVNDLRSLCNIWKVDSKLLNDVSASTFNNITEANKALYDKAIIPAVDSLSHGINKFLVRPYEKSKFNPVAKGHRLKLKPDYSGITCLQEDKTKQMERFSKLLVRVPNDERRAMGLEPLDAPEANEPWVQSIGGWIPLALFNDPTGEEPEDEGSKSHFLNVS